MSYNLKNKVVVLTGATGGIGGAIAHDFLIEGAKVICLIRNEVKFEALTKEIKDSGTSTSYLYARKCDLLDYENIQKVISEIIEEFDQLDVLINCAGQVDEAPFALLDIEQVDKMLDINLKSPLYLSKAVLRQMFKQNSGCIIMISSASAVKKGRGIAVYAAAKSGQDAFVRCLATEVGRKKIRINGIRPGIITTNMSEAVIFRLEKEMKSSISLGRFGKPKEISKAALFLASEELSSYMTGECITIDGGMY